MVMAIENMALYIERDLEYGCKKLKKTEGLVGKPSKRRLLGVGFVGEEIKSYRF